MASPGVYAKGVAKREEILRATLAVFEREGTSRTTMRTVAAAAGLSLAGLMHYFPSRDLLLTELMADVERDAEAQLGDPDQQISPGEFLARAAEARQSEPGRVWLYVTLLAATVDPTHPAAAFFQDRFQRIRTRIADYVRDKQAAGEIPSHIDPRHTAYSLLAAADGIQSQWLYDRTIDMGQHIRTTWHVLVHQPESVTSDAAR